MSARLGAHRYGKANVRLAVVRRQAASHHIIQMVVSVMLEGDFRAAHVEADNSQLLTTDAMRAATYALARERGVTSAEQLGLDLTQHCLDSAAAATRATVTVDEQPWQRLTVDGRPHPHAFTPAAGGRRTAACGRERGADPKVRGGVTGLRLLKTTGSAFSGFLKDRFTTLAETDDRILATSVTAEWDYRGPRVDFDHHATVVPEVLCRVFAEHHSESVQHTIYAMGEAALEACPDIDRIRFSLPNEHHVPADLAPFGLDNPGEVFVVAAAPHGVIEATVERA